MKPELESFSTQLFNILTEFNSKNKSFYVWGDFNINLLQTNNNFVESYLNNILSLSCKCAIDLPTRITENSRTLLDNIYVNENKHPYMSGVILRDISDDFGTFISISTKKLNKTKPNQLIIRDTNSFNYEMFLEELENRLQVESLAESDPVNKQFEAFYEIFHETIDKFAPAKKASRKEKRIYFKPWLSKSILKSITKKNSLFRKLYKNFTESNLEVYKKYRNTLNRTIKLAKETYYKETIDSAKGDSKKLWKIIDTLINSKNKEKNFSQKLDIEGKKVRDSQVICNNLNLYFANIGKNLAKSIRPVPHSKKLNVNKINHKSLTNSFFFTPSTTEEVNSIIKNLNNKKAIQENDIETKFLKISNAIISPIISNIFNSSTKQGKFPDALKKVEIIPIFKKGDINLFTNYRPIPILPQFSKIWEKLIFNRIYVYLEKLNLLSVTQFGFRQNYPTTHAISYIYDKLIKNADSGLYTLAAFFLI